jgi:hypothetical protein
VVLKSNKSKLIAEPDNNNDHRAYLLKDWTKSCKVHSRWIFFSSSKNLIFWLCNYVLEICSASDMQLINIMRFRNAPSNVNGVYLHVIIYKT